MGYLRLLVVSLNQFLKNNVEISLCANFFMKKGIYEDANNK